jgi:tetratricopeptide (TPR) repeat protein
MNTDIKKLYEEIYKDKDKKSSALFIKKVEQNLALIEKEYVNEDDIKKSTQILVDYAILLYERSSFKDALNFIGKSISRMEKVGTGKNLLEDKNYEEMIFHRALAYHHLKKRRKAKADFRILIHKFPDNEVYRKWIKYYKGKIFRRLELIFTILLALSITSSIILKPEDGIIDAYAFYAMFISLIGGIISLILRKVITK